MINKYNEKDLAEYMLKNGFHSKNKFYELSVLSRFLYFHGKSKEEIKSFLIDFCNRYFKNFNYVKYSSAMRKIIDSCSKYPLLQVGTIKISSNEAKECKNLNSYELSCVFFTLLCMAKIRYLLKENKYINEKISYLTKISGMTSKKKFIKLLKELISRGYVRLCINGNIEWLNDFDTDTDDVAVYVNDIEHCYLYYRNYLRGGYRECVNCGTIIKKSSNRKYCEACSKYIKNEQNKRYYHEKQK